MKINAVVLGGVMGALAVALGAFGGHVLSDILDPSRMSTFQTAVRYHFYHSILLVAMGVFGNKIELKWPVYLISSGIFLFSGSLYLIVFTGLTWAGIITPFGGAAFIAGWLALAYHGRKLIN